MKRTITGLALISILVFAATAWSQDSPKGHGKMEMGESSDKKACMQMMAKMEASNAALDALVEQMQAAECVEDPEELSDLSLEEHKQVLPLLVVKRAVRIFAQKPMVDTESRSTGFDSSFVEPTDEVFKAGEQAGALGV